jgi:hypothetical protein
MKTKGDIYKIWKVGGMVLPLFVVLIILSWISFTKSVNAAWFNDLWQYRQRITVTATTANLTDYQVPVTINTQTLFNAGKLQSKCEDLRFTDQDGNILDYWVANEADAGINPQCSTSTATQIWIRIPAIYTTGTYIYMYYGNRNVSAFQNGARTFEMFDHFNESFFNNNKWESTGSPTQGSGVLSLVNGAKVRSTVSFPMGYRVIAGVRQQSTALNIGSIGFSNSSLSSAFTADDSAYFYFDSTTGNNFERGASNESTITTNAGTVTETATTRVLNVGWRSVSSIDFSIDSTVDTTITTNMPNESMFVRVENSSATDTLYVEWIAVAKYSPNFTTTPTFGSEEKTISPVLYYDFEEVTQSIVPDRSGQGNNGTATNGPRLTDNCISGKCLDFDGINDQILMMNPKGMPTGGTDRTIAMWIYPRPLGAIDSGTMFSMGDGPGGGQEFMFQNGPYIGAHYLYTDGVNGANNIAITGAEIPPYNAWSYIVFTLNANNWKYYINSKLVKQGTFPVGVNTSVDRFMVGGRTDGAAAVDYFYGLIDELKVYDRVLTSTEMLQQYNLYNSALGANGSKAQENFDKTDNLVARWKMNETTWNGTATEVKDDIAPAAHGTAANGAYTVEGYYQRSGRFDRINDYVSIPYVSKFDLQQFTISSWVLASNFSQNGFIFEKTTNGVVNTQYACFFEAGNIVFRTYNASAVQDNLSVSVVDSGINNGEWNNIICSYDQQFKRIYSNGVLVASKNYTQTLAVGGGAGTSRIGSHLSNGYYFNGFIDEVRIFNKGLTQGEIDALLEMKPSALLHLKFDELTGTTANDTSISVNNLLLNNTTNAGWINGRIGNAFRFDGIDDYGAATGNENPVFSYSFWINAEDVTSVGVFNTAESPGALAHDRDIYFNASGNIVGRIYPDTYNAIVTSTTVFSPNRWYHIVFLYDGGNLKLYVDNRLESVVSAAFPFAGYSTPEIVIGYTDTNMGVETLASGRFVGKIDDFKIFAYPLSQKEIGAEFARNTESSFAMEGNGSGLIAWYRFNEIALTGSANDVIDHSGNSLHGTSIGGARTSSILYKEYPSSIELDGSNDYVNIPYNSVLNSQTVTMSAWLKPESSGVFQTPVTREPDQVSSQIGYGLRQRTNNKWWFTVGREGYGIAAESVSSLVVNEWQHIVGTYDGATVKIYVNGRLEDTEAFTEIVNATSDMKIGRLNSSLLNYFNGNIDDLRIYNRTLSDAEVKKLYDSYSPITNPRTLVAGSEVTTVSPSLFLKLDEKSGGSSQDSSINRRTGTLVNMANESWVKGMIGNSLKFDGIDDYMSIADDTVFTPTASGLTASAWVKINAIESNGGEIRAPIISKFPVDAPASNWEWTLMASGTTEPRFVMGMTNTAGTWLSRAESSTIVQMGTWYHVVGVITSTGATQIYVNGILDGSAAAGGFSSNTATEVFIGAQYGSGNQWNFNGTIDNVKIWNSALSQRNIAFEYNGGKPYAWWSFDEGQGSTVKDYSGNGNQGTMLNMDPATDWLPESSCKLNQCLDMDSINDYINVSDIPFRFGATDFSYSFWYYFDGVNKRAGLLGKRQPSGTFSQFAIFAAGSFEGAVAGKRIIASFVPDGSTYAINFVAFGPEMSVGWNHIVAVKQTGQQGMLYLNGTLVASTSTVYTTQTFNYVGHNFQIGNINSGLVYLNGGRMDELKIFRYSLTTDDVKREYNNGAALRFE